MAGYFLYSLDHDKLTKFISSPTAKPLSKLAELVSDALDRYDNDFEDGDAVAEWPSEPEELKPILKAHLALEDWYADLSDAGKRLWEDAFTRLCDEKSVFDFKCECDGIYWNVVEEALQSHGLRPGTITPMELTHFGTRPLHYLQQGAIPYDSWYPYHSMHTADEVERLIEQFTAAKKAIRASRHKDARIDFDILMPVLEKVASSNRVLYVAVDT